MARAGSRGMVLRVSTKGFHVVNLITHLEALPLQTPTLNILGLDGEQVEAPYNTVECADSNATLADS